MKPKKNPKKAYMIGTPIRVHAPDWNGDKDEEPLFILEWKALEIQEGVKIGKVSVDYSLDTL